MVPVENIPRRGRAFGVGEQRGCLYALSVEVYYLCT